MASFEAQILKTAWEKKVSDKLPEDKLYFTRLYYSNSCKRDVRQGRFARMQNSLCVNLGLVSSAWQKIGTEIHESPTST